MNARLDSIKQAHIDAALEVCEAIDAICEEADEQAGVREGQIDPKIVAVLAARLHCEGDRAQLLEVSKASLEVASDDRLAQIIAEVDDDEEDDDEEDDEDEDDEATCPRCGFGVEGGHGSCLHPWHRSPDRAR